jgi:hypothetical protein
LPSDDEEAQEVMGPGQYIKPAGSVAAPPPRWTIIHGFIAGFGFGGFSLPVVELASSSENLYKMLNRLAWKESVHNPVKMLSERELTIHMQAGRNLPEENPPPSRSRMIALPDTYIRMTTS